MTRRLDRALLWLIAHTPTRLVIVARVWFAITKGHRR